MKSKLLLVIIFLLSLGIADAARAVGIIRDEEIERALKKYTEPVFAAAGINADSVNIIMVEDNSLNAFVAGGMNMFIHTGLLMESDDPLMIIGVMAHEAGHISGGHLVRKAEDMEKSSMEAAIGYVLGAASIAAGVPAAGQALIAGGSHVAQRNFLKYSRLHEAAADQAALASLQKAGFSPRGLLTLLEKLYSNEKMLFNEIDPYAQTHPLSQERINHLRSHMKVNKTADLPVPEDLLTIHKRIVAKLEGFLKPPAEIFKKYADDDSLPAHYARAIAHYRLHDVEKSLHEIDYLLERNPDDAYFHELKGQVLFEHGRVEESLAAYEKAKVLIPGSSLFLLELATAELATEDDKLLAPAIENLEKVVVKEPKNAQAWRQLAIAYGRNKQIGMSYLALAEEATLREKEDDIKLFTRLAAEILPKDSPGALRAKDLKRLHAQKNDKIFKEEEADKDMSKQ